MFIIKIPTANAALPHRTCTDPGSRLQGYPVSQMCLRFGDSNVPVNATVTNLPSGKNVYIGCDGDSGNGYVINKKTVNGVCVGQYCNGHYDGPVIGQGTNWCKGDIAEIIPGNNRTGIINGTATLTNCSCRDTQGCIKVAIAPNLPVMENTCNDSDPTFNTTGITPEALGCTVTGGMCGPNGIVKYPNLNIQCPAPKADVPVKVYVDNDNNNVLNKSVDTLYTGNISVAEGGSTFTGTGTTTIPGLDIGSNITATLANITSYNIIINPPLANPVANYTVLSSGNEIDYLIQAPRCVPATCSSAQVCGDIPSGCTGVAPIHCGDCTSPNTCSNNACTCTPITSCGANQVCGSIPNGCGGTVTCGTCDAATGQTCNNNACSCPTGQTPTHLACGTNHTCQVVNTCGVDSCTAGQNCGPATTLSFVIGLDGIGTTGDQLNPGWTQLAGQPLSGSTLSPVHTTRPVTVYLTDSAQHTQQFQGNIAYDPTTTDQNYGKFATVTPIDLGVHIQAGTYTVYVTVAAHLTKSLGPVTITLGQNNPVANGQNAGNLVAGDITGVSSNTADNTLTIEDYNVLMSCSIYSKDSTLCQSDSLFSTLSDLDDNGDSTTARAPLINQFDYNLWLREYSKTPNGDTPPNITTSASAQTQASPALTVVSVVNNEPSPSVAIPSGTEPAPSETEPSGTQPSVIPSPSVEPSPSVAIPSETQPSIEPSPSVAVPSGTTQQSTGGQ